MRNWSESPIEVVLNIDPEIYRRELNDPITPLAVYHASRSSFQSIPASLDPLVIPDEAWAPVTHAADLTIKAMNAIIKLWREPEHQGRADQIFSELSPFEGRNLQLPDEESLKLATARLDLFFDGKVLKIIEANTTIPAMQAYSDIVRGAWLKSAGVQNNDSPNSLDLLHSLLHLYRRHGGASPLPAIAVVAREGDSQIAELRYLKKIWEQKGHPVEILRAEDLKIQGQKLSTAQGQSFDLIYRHIFASRLTEGSDFAKACLRNKDFHIYNPIAAHLETKALFAELSQVSSDRRLSEAIGLSLAEQDLLQKHLPWTRILHQHRGLNEQNNALEEWLSLDPEHYVIKSSSGYGGHKVFIGSDFETKETQSRLKQLLRSEKPVGWADFLNYCTKATSEAWIIQRRMQGQRMKHRFLCDNVSEQESYVDASIFVWSHGLPRGGASRFSTDPIVNIGRGGGLLPLFLQSEYNSMINTVAKQ
jgi:hypothetical protein